MAINKKSTLSGKRVLITAGPSWVAIDSVRVISNTASGRTGVLLAQHFSRLGAKVTLLLGPVGPCSLNKRIKLLRFCFFDELKNSLERELSFFRYDAVIHAAAVSDYRIPGLYRRKIKSGIRGLRIKLVPTPKIINCIKRISPFSLAVGFKFEPQESKAVLLKEAKTLMRSSGTDIVVANTIKDKRYRAYLVSASGVCGPFATKEGMGRALLRLIGKRLS